MTSTDFRNGRSNSRLPTGARRQGSLDGTGMSSSGSHGGGRKSRKKTGGGGGGGGGGGSAPISAAAAGSNTSGGGEQVKACTRSSFGSMGLYMYCTPQLVSLFKNATLRQCRWQSRSARRPCGESLRLPSMESFARMVVNRQG